MNKVLWKLLMAASIVAVATVCNAQCDGPRRGLCADTPEPPSYLVQIEAEFGSASTDTGSGSLIKSQYVMTCWHNLRNYRVGKLYVRLSDGTRVAAVPVKKHRIRDMALLKLDKPVLLPTVKLGDEEPRRGDAITLHGFHPDGDGGRAYKRVEGQVLGRFSAQRRPGSLPVMYGISAKGRPGMSGGPVVNEDGKLVGVFWGTLGTGYAVGIEAILKFLDSETDLKLDEGWFDVDNLD